MPTLYPGVFSVPTVMVQITLPVRMVQAYNPSTWEAKAQGLITDNNPPAPIRQLTVTQHTSGELLLLLASAQSAIQSGLVMALPYRVLTTSSSSHDKEQEC